MKLVIFNRYVSIKEITLSLILGISALCFFVIMLFHECEFDGYKYLFVLPLVFGIMCFACSNLFSRILESPVILILFVTYYIRMCLSPFLYVVSGYPSFFGVRVDSSFYYQATFLLSLETILVFLVLKFLFNKKNASNNIVFGDSTVKINVTILSCVVLILFLFVIFVYLAIPELQETNILIFKADFSTLANINYDNESIVARMTLFYKRQLVSKKYRILQTKACTHFFKIFLKFYGDELRDNPTTRSHQTSFDFDKTAAEPYAKVVIHRIRDF